MKLLVSCLGYDSGKSGISAYMRNVVACLKECDADITLVVESGDEGDFEGFKKITAPAKFSKSAKGWLWHIFALPFYARKFDCLLVLAGNRRFAVFGRAPKVGVIHDLSQYRVKGKYDPLRMFYLSKVQPLLGRGFSAMAAISGSTKEDIEKYWRVAPEKITLNYNGLSKLCEPDGGVLTRLKLQKYIYYVSRIEHPGKNHAGLIKAYEALPQSLRDEYKLVFTGSNWNGADTVREMAKNSPCAGNIVFTGFVTDAELSALYKNASLFVFPSFSEGFGLGLVEAMAAGVPCACSKDSALGEIGADAALKFDPYSADEIRACMEKILTDEALAAELVKKGEARAKDFDWGKHARTLMDICRKECAKYDKLKIFDIPFDNARMPDIVKRLEERARGDGKTSVAFINTHYLNTAYEHPDQIERLKKFDFVLPDGSGVSTACRILRCPYRDNLNGTDLLPQLCELSKREGFTMYFLGGKPTVAQRAADNLLKSWSGLKILGTHDGYFQDKQKIIDEINALKPDFLFVGFGVILQEKWVLENIGALNCKVVLAVGGLCDVYSGDLFRVHPKLRELGLEWLGRLWQDPVRLFGRYVIGNPLFVLRVFKYKFTRRGHL